MKTPFGIARHAAVKVKSILHSVLLSYPERVECNICGWKGQHFMSDSWHRHINCPACHSGIRQRLFVAALQNIKELSFDNLIGNKTILHFAPEDSVRSGIRKRVAHYTTADFLRRDCDLQLDMSSMPEVGNGSFDVVIAFDVLEHVTDYVKALEEIHRVLTSQGFGIFTVPQKDDLEVTLEDPTVVTPEDRERKFGQWDHLRIFGSDFARRVESMGFKVTAIDESRFPDDVVRRHVLFPPELSTHPLATNFRKIFFCQKTS